MTRDARPKFFIDCLISTTRLMLDIKDGFFVKRIYSGLSNLIAVHQQKPFDMASISLVIREMLGIFDYVEHLKISNPIPLLSARKSLLRYKLEIIRSEVVDTGAKVKIGGVNASSSKSPKLIQGKATRKVMNLNLNPTKEQILEYIKKSPNVRTKQVVDEFNLISPRTVIRSLKELSDQGLIHKKNENKAVHYSLGQE